MKNAKTKGRDGWGGPVGSGSRGEFTLEEGRIEKSKGRWKVEEEEEENNKDEDEGEDKDEDEEEGSSAGCDSVRLLCPTSGEGGFFFFFFFFFLLACFLACLLSVLFTFLIPLTSPPSFPPSFSAHSAHSSLRPPQDTDSSSFNTLTYNTFTTHTLPPFHHHTHTGRLPLPWASSC